MSKYTPGPWEVVDRSIFQTDAVGGRQIIHGSAIKGRNRTEEIDANTHLIAASPDLLEACKNMLWHEDKYAAHKQAEAAVAKAEGRQ